MCESRDFVDFGPSKMPTGERSSRHHDQLLLTHLFRLSLIPSRLKGLLDKGTRTHHTHTHHTHTHTHTGQRHAGSCSWQAVETE